MTSKTTYLGENKMHSVHLDSGNEMDLVIPPDNYNKRDNFSPTDLFATSFAQSMFAAIAVLGESKKIDITGATCELKKTMYFNPRRIGEIFCVVKFPKNYSEDDRKFIEETAAQSPVNLSLNPEIKKIVLFEYAD